LSTRRRRRSSANSLRQRDSDPGPDWTQDSGRPCGLGRQGASSPGFAKTGGCGLDQAAGANGSRTGSNVQIHTGTIATSTYCYDYASRLTSVTGANPIDPSTISYDSHGNATRIGDQTWTYDAADRVSGTGVLSKREAIAYTRDSTGRVVTRAATGPEAATTRYGFSSTDDSPDFQLGTGDAITERYLSLPGGVLVTKPYGTPAGPSSYAIPNWHGDITAQVTVNGTAVTVTGAGWINDPYGQPLNPATGMVDLTATPMTRTNTSTTDAWLGQHQRGFEHTSGLSQILMGARTYLPALGIFTSTDPIPAGNETTYGYPVDPTNLVDLSGERGVLKRLRHAASQFVTHVGYVGLGMGGFISYASELSKHTSKAARALRSGGQGRAAAGKLLSTVAKSKGLTAASRAGRMGGSLAGGALVAVGAILTYGADVTDGYSQGYAVGHAVVTSLFSVGFGILGGMVGGPIGAAIGGVVGGLLGDALFGLAAKTWGWN
jgi:RHS repeat-associated protein